MRGANGESQGRGVLLPRMAGLGDPQRDRVPRFRGGPHGEPMIEPEEMLEQREIGGAGKAPDFPNLMFIKLSVLGTARLGSRDRHRHLQDIADLLTPFHDADYGTDMDKAREMRQELLEEGKSDGNLTLIERKEAVDVHQRLWLAALMQMMKRRGLLGETWIRG